MRWFLIILGIVILVGGIKGFKGTESILIILIGILLIYKGYRMFSNNIFRKLEERKFLKEKEKFLQNKNR